MGNSFATINGSKRVPKVKMIVKVTWKALLGFHPGKKYF